MTTLFDKIRKECKSKYIVPDIYKNKYINQKTGELVTIDDPSKLRPDKLIYLSKYHKPSDIIYLIYSEKTENGYLVAIAKASIEINKITIIEENHATIIVDENSVRLSETNTKKSINDIVKITNKNAFFYMLKSDIEEILKPDDYNRMNNINFNGHKSVNEHITKRVCNLLTRLKKEPLLTFRDKSLSKCENEFVKMIAKDKLLINSLNWRFLLDLTKQQAYELPDASLVRYQMRPTEIRLAQCIVNPNIIDKKSFKGTYLESLIYRDTNKTMTLLNELACKPNYESFIKIVKDYKDYKRLMRFTSDSKTYTKLLLSENGSLYANYTIKRLVESLPDCDIDEINLMAHITAMDENLKPMQISNLLPYERNKPICEPILKMLNKTAVKLTNRLNSIPDLDNILIKNVKTTDVNWLETYGKEALKNINKKSIDEQKAIYLNLFMGTQSSLDVILMDKHLSKMLFNKNTDIIETIKAANAKFIENTYLNTKNNLVTSTADMYNMYNRLKELGFTVKKPTSLTIDKMFALHDYYSDIIKENQEFVNKAVFDKIKDAYKKYEYENDRFMVISPESQEDIVNEGLVLHHCVASYVNRHIDGLSAIMFIRKKDEPDKPFYTMEICPNNNSIIQVRGKCNCGKTPEVTEFVNKYKAAVLKRKAKRIAC